jgi:hypothetical protein
MERLIGLTPAIEQIPDSRSPGVRRIQNDD